MDLLGEQTVHVVTATLQAAIVLLVAALAVVSSARVARSAALRPAPVAHACTGRLRCLDRDDVKSFPGLHTCLPTRAPPGGDPPSDMVSTARWESSGDETFARPRAIPRSGVGR